MFVDVINGLKKVRRVLCIGRDYFSFVNHSIYFMCLKLKVVFIHQSDITKLKLFHLLIRKNLHITSHVVWGNYGPVIAF